MQVVREFISLPDSFKANKHLLFISLILLFPAVLIAASFGITFKIIIVFVILPVALFSLTSFKISLCFFTVLVFSDIAFLRMYSVVPYSILLFFGFLLYEYDNKAALFNHQLAKWFYLYFFTMLISLINSSNILLSLYLMINYVGMFLIIALVKNYLTTFENYRRTVKIFFSFNVLNGIVIIFLNLFTSERVFGFIGIVFVDFASLAILILIIYLMFSQGTKTLLYLSLLIFLLISLFVTQTRSSLGVLALSVLLLFGYLFFQAEIFNLKKSKVGAIFFSSIIIIGGLVGVLLLTNPEIFSRFQGLQNTDVSSLKFETDFTQSSFFSRLLIWSVSLRAFEAHPIIGMGAFSFQFASEQYSALTPFLYKTFVEGLSPHVAYLAVLVETGIVGLIAFLLLWIAIFKLAFKNIRNAVSVESKKYSLITLFVQVYIFISMGITDAWLWGQSAMLWGISLGILLSLYEIVRRESINIKIKPTG